MPVSSVHFNGSVNLPDAETVMREISSRVPQGVSRMTDGETGERIDWVFFQSSRFAETGQFVRESAGDGPGADYGSTRRVRLSDGMRPDDVRWPDLGYESSYARSYETFRSLRTDGVIPADVRLQVQYPTPSAGLSFVEPKDAARLVDSYTAALYADLERAMRSIPHDEVAVQWDAPVEVGMLARQEMTDGAADYATVVPGLIRCLEQVPSDVPVGMHLCYGDLGHRHFLEPESLAIQVRLINALTAACPRRIDWFSITVPQNRSDDAFFAPIAELTSDAATVLSFGIVPYHPADQEPGVTRRQVELIDSGLARSTAGARDWAVSTECGMGRVNRDDVPRLLDVHREILAGDR